MDLDDIPPNNSNKNHKLNIFMVFNVTFLSHD